MAWPNTACQYQDIFQYSVTEGYLPLRAYIAQRYAQRGMQVTPDQIILTNGSQQALDLLGKIFLDPGDKVIIEKPGYVGAIQSFSMYEPDFQGVALEADGVDLQALEEKLALDGIKFFYSVPSFQNPSGLSYSEDKRRTVAELLQKYSTPLIEDDPYSELRFMGRDLPPIKRFLPDLGIMMGSFSKIIAPGFRLGWICAPGNIMAHLHTAKQAADSPQES